MFVLSRMDQTPWDPKIQETENVYNPSVSIWHNSLLKPRAQTPSGHAGKNKKLTKVGGDATPKSHTAVTKDLSGFAVSESAPLPPIDSCKMEFLGAGPG